MTTLLEPTTVVMRLLWVDDLFEDLKGFVDRLEYIGHIVTRAYDPENAAERLRESVYDLLILDQQLLTADLTEDDTAGASLVTSLKQGEYGELNVTIPFLFLTGSRDWVIRRTPAVVDLQGFLEVEEKGDDILSCILRHVAGISRRPDPEGSDGRTPDPSEGEPRKNAEIPPGEDYGEYGGDDVSGPIVLVERWWGTVTFVEMQMFGARLTDAAGILEDHLATFSIDAVSERARHLIAEHAEFEWEVGYWDDPDESRTSVSRIRFLTPDLPSPEEVVAARRAADGLIE